MAYSDAISFLNAAAVKDRATALAGESSNLAHNIAIAIVVAHDQPANAAAVLEANAEARAIEIFNGQDWKRELALYDNFTQGRFNG